MKRTKVKRTKNKKAPEKQEQTRTKPDKSKLKRNFPLGGHLPEPPEDCKAKHRFIWRDGIYWIDFGMCIRTCAKNDKTKNDFSKSFCSRAREYLKEREEERREALRKKEE
ncbi:MAG TPA: hypothetical protein VK982_12025 [Bacteroidales bacterium]|nr:hypothetical protein [Bacteroidales bacterium]